MIKTYLYIFICLTVFAACSTENIDEPTVPPIDTTWETIDMPGSSVTVTGFECGDATTRSSWQFNGQKMVFGWEQGDAIGLYPTAGTSIEPSEENSWEESNPTLVDPSVQKHPLYDNDKVCHTKGTRAQATKAYVKYFTKDSQTQSLHIDDGSFVWEEQTRWTTYKPYNPNYNPNAEPSVYYTALPVDFSDQTQQGLTDMQALYQGKGGQPKGYNNPVYMETEAVACKHLASADFCISPEMVWAGERINFEFRHVGAIARLFMLAPEANLTLKKMELICDSKIFHSTGEVDLTSHLYDAGATNKGVKLVGDVAPIQITPTDEPSQKVTLKFVENVKIQKPTADNKYLNYLVAYMMLYPIDYQSERDGNLFAYVTALDENGKEVHFVSEPLSDRNLKSGYYYQWTLRTHEDDGLYPIRLTATLLPWQNIVGAGINTGLEK